jgi:hypothetical protein
VTRRSFYIALGAVAGVLVVRKLTSVATRFTPAGVQQSMGGAIGNLADAIREFGVQVREGMAEREDELRTSLGLDGSHDLVDAPEYADPAHTGGVRDDVDGTGHR